MRRMSITINGRTYQINCDSEQSDHIQQLSHEINGRAETIAESMPRASEATILMMTCLHLADELYETRQEAGELHEKILFERHDLHEVFHDNTPNLSMDANQKLTDMMHNVSGSLEELTAKLEQL